MYKGKILSKIYSFKQKILKFSWKIYFAETAPNSWRTEKKEERLFINRISKISFFLINNTKIVF